MRLLIAGCPSNSAAEPLQWQFLLILTNLLQIVRLRQKAGLTAEPYLWTLLVKSHVKRRWSSHTIMAYNTEYRFLNFALKLCLATGFDLIFYYYTMTQDRAIYKDWLHISPTTLCIRGESHLDVVGFEPSRERPIIKLPIHCIRAYGAGCYYSWVESDFGYQNHSHYS